MKAKIAILLFLLSMSAPALAQGPAEPGDTQTKRYAGNTVIGTSLDEVGLPDTGGANFGPLGSGVARVSVVIEDDSGKPIGGGWDFIGAGVTPLFSRSIASGTFCVGAVLVVPQGATSLSVTVGVPWGAQECFESGNGVWPATEGDIRVAFL